VDLTPVSLHTDDGAITLDNGLVALHFCDQTGCWLGMTDRRTNRVVLGNPHRRPTLEVVSGGRERVTSAVKERFDPLLTGEEHYFAEQLVEHYLLQEIDGATLVLVLQAGPWRVRERWHLQPGSDTARRQLELVWQGSAPTRLRHFIWTMPRLTLGASGRVTFEAPGVPIAPHRPLDSLAADFSMSLGETPSGHPGMVGLCERESGQTVCVWPYSATEPALGNVWREGDGIRVEYRVLLSDEVEPGQGITGGAMYARTNDAGWEALLQDMHPWYDSVGLRVPEDSPEWTTSATLYELHIGNAVVKYGPYEPLPRVQDLLARLPEIKRLGFDTIQIMPHQFFAGYSVHDYYDVTTQYGEEAALRQVIATAHSLDMRVILDIVVHGCNDKEVARRTYERTEHSEPEWFLRWIEAAVEHHPYLDEHPEWFMRDEEGQIRATYTWAFDHLNPSFQRFLIDVLKFYLLDLGADGFRIDAPTWNYFPNWKRGLPYRAGDTYYGWAQLFARARAELKQAKPELMLFSEGIGPLHARDFDLRYAYEEQWLFPAALQGGGAPAVDMPGQVDGQPITAVELAEWLHERRLSHPAGTRIAHFIDSHDSFWPKALFRRRIVGPDAWRPCFALCATLDGCLMHYIGGEEGNEEFVRRLLALRRTLPELHHGACDYRALQPDTPMVFAPLRSLGNRHTIPVMSFDSTPTRTRLRLPASLSAPDAGEYTVYDALNDRLLIGAGEWGAATSAGLEVELPAYGVAVLVLRPVS
jgi:glycosidase